MTKKQKKMLWRIVITAVMIIALHFLPITGITEPNPVLVRLRNI